MKWQEELIERLEQQRRINAKSDAVTAVQDAPPVDPQGALAALGRLGLLRKPANSPLTTDNPLLPNQTSSAERLRALLGGVSDTRTAPFQMPKPITLSEELRMTPFRPEAERAIRQTLGVPDQPAPERRKTTEELLGRPPRERKTPILADPRIYETLPDWQKELVDIGNVGALVAGGVAVALTLNQGYTALTNLTTRLAFQKAAAERGGKLTSEELRAVQTYVETNFTRNSTLKASLNTLFKKSPKGFQMTDAATKVADEEATKAIAAWKPTLAPKFTPGGSAVPGQTKPLSSILAGVENKLVKPTPESVAAKLAKNQKLTYSEATLLSEQPEKVQAASDALKTGGMAASTSVQTGLQGLGKEAAQSQLFGEVSGKTSQKAPLIEVPQVVKPLKGQVPIPESQADYEALAEAEGLRETMAQDPVANYRFKVGKANVGLDSLISIRESNFPQYLTVKQAQALRPYSDWSAYLQKGTPNYNHIPAVNVLDTIAKELGYDYTGGIDDLANRIMQIRQEKARIAQLSRAVGTIPQASPVPIKAATKPVVKVTKTPAVTAIPQAQIKALQQAVPAGGEGVVTPSVSSPPASIPETAQVLKTDTTASGQPPAEIPPSAGIGGDVPTPHDPPPIVPTSLGENVIGLRPIEPGLTRQQTIANWVRSQFSKAYTKVGGHPLVLEDALATPAMVERARVSTAIESVANILGTKAEAEVNSVFKFDKQGRITTLAKVIPEIGAPTIQDVAARLPLYQNSLTTDELRVLSSLRDAVKPYSDLLAEVGVEVRSRGDVMDGGFYLPRGNAGIEGQDLPYKVSGGGIRGNKKGFEKPAVFDSMAQGIEAGYEYRPLGQSLTSYAFDAGSRATDAHIGNYFKALTDDTGRLLGETAKMRMLRTHPEIAQSVEDIKANLTKLKSNIGALTERQEGVITLWSNDPEFADTSSLIISLQEGLASMKGGKPAQTRVDLAKLLKENLDALKALKPGYDKAMREAAVTPRDQGVIILPALQGRTFPNDLANAANIILRKEGLTGNDLLRTVQAYNNLYIGMRSTLDNSSLGIQGLLMAYDNPVAFGKAVAVNLKAWGLNGDQVLGKFIKEFDETASKNGRLTASEWARAGLHQGGATSEFMLQGLGGRIGNLPGVRQSNRAFGFFGDAARLEWVDSELKSLLRGSTLEQLKTDGKLEEIASGANVMTGWARTPAGGDFGKTLLLAARFLEARLETVTKAAKGLRPGATVDQQMARNALLKMIGFGVMLTVAANAAIGEDTDFRPVVDGKRNPYFMRIKVGSTYYSMWGTWDSLLGMVINIGVGRPLQVVRNLGSGTTTGAFDIITGRDYNYKPVTDTPLHFAQWVGKSFIPFGVGQLPESIGQIAGGHPVAGGVNVVSQLLGIKSFTQNKADALKNQWSSDAGIKAYNAIPTNTQEVLAKRSQFPLTRAQYLVKNPDVAAKLFIQGDLSSLSTMPQVTTAIQLMKGNKLTIADIPSLAASQYESPTHKALRTYFEKQFGVTQQATPQPSTQPAPDQPTRKFSRTKR